MHGDLKGRMMARLVGNSGLMGHNVVNRFGRRQLSARTDFQHYLHGKKGGENGKCFATVV